LITQTNAVRVPAANSVVHMTQENYASIGLK